MPLMREEHWTISAYPNRRKCLVSVAENWPASVFPAATASLPGEASDSSDRCFTLFFSIFSVFGGRFNRAFEAYYNGSWSASIRPSMSFTIGVARANAFCSVWPRNVSMITRAAATGSPFRSCNGMVTSTNFLPFP